MLSVESYKKEDARTVLIAFFFKSYWRTKKTGVRRCYQICLKSRNKLQSHVHWRGRRGIVFLTRKMLHSKKGKLDLVRNIKTTDILFPVKNKRVSLVLFWCPPSSSQEKTHCVSIVQTRLCPATWATCRVKWDSRHSSSIVCKHYKWAGRVFKRRPCK